VIRPAVPPDLSAGERYGLDVLLDLSRLLVVLDPAADVVRLTIGASTPPPVSLDHFARYDMTPVRGDGEVHIGRDVLNCVTALAGAGAEQGVRATDRHGRVPSAENPLVRAGRERVPVVQRYAAELRAAVRAVAGRRPVRLLAPWPDGRRWAAAITHDLDVVAGWPVFTLLRVAELVRGGEVARAGRVVGAAARAVGRNPVLASVRALLEVERAAGLPATWFVLCGTPTPATWLRGDLTYTPESHSNRRLLDEITQAGHEIGLHGSFATTLDADRLREERERLGRLIGAAPTGVRQHFLRMRPGRTQAAMQAAGFGYDATYGFPDRNGLRLGVADSVPAWFGDGAAPLETVPLVWPDGAAPLESVPLVWMDRALSKYRGVEDPNAWVADALSLAATCRDVEGLWVGLWHPNLTAALGYPGAPDAVRRLLASLAAEAPFWGTVGQIVDWRRARRAARVRRVGVDGAIDLVTAGGSNWSMSVEDERGRVVSAGIRPGGDG
jgi:peptidoglycan/xylan/chitin deacetylase (PgdA/CDA1 family)